MVCIRAIHEHYVNVVFHRDCVSSVGIVKDKLLPLTHSSDHICYFRHALALDERRVKFLPECVFPRSDEDGRWPGRRKSMERLDETNGHDIKADTRRNEDDPALIVDDSRQTKVKQLLHVKEVWFSGCHADMYVRLIWLAIYCFAYQPQPAVAVIKPMRHSIRMMYLPSGWPTRR